MMKIALPVLLAGIVMIAGIFAFMPVDKATTVHTTIQGTQLNNVASAFTDSLILNATATCSSGSFLVYWTFTNSTAQTTTNVVSNLLIDDLQAGGTDITIALALTNQTSISGVVGGTSGETITLSGSPTGTNTGDVVITVQCRSTASATVSVT